MRRPVALFVGLRYLRASRGNGFVSFVNAASVLGVALGVAALIVVMSVMNGFENELRDRLLGLTSHATVINADGFPDWAAIADALEGQPGIRGAAPVIELEGMLAGPGGMTAAKLSGVVPARERRVSALESHFVVGTLDDLQPGAGHIVLGRSLAQKLGAGPGDTLSVLLPRPTLTGTASASALTAFTVSGVFEMGVQEHDAVRAMIHLDDGLVAGGVTRPVTGIRVETDDIFAAPQTVRRALAAIEHPDTTMVRDWTQENSSYFRAIRLEKTMMAVLLSLVIAVAAFNIVAMLVMVVTEKRSGIAILRTLGCSAREVVSVFLLQGTVLGWLGAVTGTVLGVWMTLNIGILAPALEDLFGFRFMPADVYYLTALPAELRPGDVLAASLGVLAITALATVYPALRASSVEPAEVLRYE